MEDGMQKYEVSSISGSYIQGCTNTIFVSLESIVVQHPSEGATALLRIQICPFGSTDSIEVQCYIAGVPLFKQGKCNILEVSVDVFSFQTSDSHDDLIFEC